MVLCLNFTLLVRKVILVTEPHCLQGTCLSPWEERSVLHFLVASSSRTEREPLPISLNRKGIRANNVTVPSFWTLPIYKCGVPKRKEQLLDQCRKWRGSLHRPGACGSHWFVDQSCLKCCEAAIYQCQSCVRRRQASPLCFLGWNPKVVTREEREMLVSSEESSTELCCKVKGVSTCLGEEPRYPSLLNVPQTVLAKVIGTFTLLF